MSDTVDPAELTARIAAAYVFNNTVERSELAGLIESVGTAIRQSTAKNTKAEEPPPQKPAVTIRKSITPDYLISLEDGRHYRTLKRHLATHGLTPETYRSKWGLPDEYPMIAPSYSAMRSEMATKNRLGYSRQKAEEEPAVAPTLKAKRGRKAAQR